MTIGSVQLSEALQCLIDSRLDTIDRMLLGRVARPDRLAIVAEVESQIFELLQERQVDALTRADVLAALARLDPPEAYLPDDDHDDDDSGDVSIRRRNPVRPAERTVAPARSMRAARAGGILGLSAMGMVVLTPLFFVLGELTGSEILAFTVWFGALGLTSAASVLGIVFGVFGRRSVWGVAGLVTGILSLLVTIGLGSFLLLQLVA